MAGHISILSFSYLQVIFSPMPATRQPPEIGNQAEAGFLLI
jgi:hypothetical protein